MNTETVTLDVRDDIRNGREPFSKIMSVVRELRPEQGLRLIAPFKPIPLFNVLNEQGFAHEARPMENGDWEVLFTQTSEKPEGQDNLSLIETRSEKAAPCKQPLDSKEMLFIRVDARGLEPPLPMVRILETLANLPEGAGVRAHTDRRPMHLYAQLEGRGFTGKSEEQNDGSFITHIHRS